MLYLVTYQFSDIRIDVQGGLCHNLCAMLLRYECNRTVSTSFIMNVRKTIFIVFATNRSVTFRKDGHETSVYR